MAYSPRAAPHLFIQKTFTRSNKMEDLMDLIGQLQERYGIDQADVDTLVDAINQTFVGGDEVGRASCRERV